ARLSGGHRRRAPLPGAPEAPRTPDPPWHRAFGGLAGGGRGRGGDERDDGAGVARRDHDRGRDPVRPRRSRRGGLVPATVVALTEAVLRAMALGRLKLAVKL